MNQLRATGGVPTAIHRCLISTLRPGNRYCSRLAKTRSKGMHVTARDTACHLRGHSMRSKHPLWNIQNCVLSVGWPSSALLILLHSVWNYVWVQTLTLNLCTQCPGLAGPWEEHKQNATIKKRTLSKTVSCFPKFQGERDRKVGIQRCLWESEFTWW